MFDNPFTYGAPITDAKRFYGRRSAADQIFSRLKNSAADSSSIVGERRIGKTSLLNYVMDPQVQKSYGVDTQKFKFIYLDLQIVDSKTNSTHLYKHILTKFSRLHPDVDVAILINRLQNIDEINTMALQNFFDELDIKELNLVWLLDEFENVTNNPNFGKDFFDGLRALATRRNLTLITSTRKTLDALVHSEAIRTSPFFNIFANINVSLLSQEEAETLILDTLSQSQIRFAPPDYKFLFQLSGYHPFFLQIAGFFLFSAYQQKFPQPDRQEYLRIRFADEASPHFGSFWKNSEDKQKIVLATMALLMRQYKGDADKIANQNQLQRLYDKSEQTLPDLEKRGLVQRVSGDYKLFSVEFGSWILQELTAIKRDKQSYQDWLKSNQTTMERLSSGVREQALEILPKVSANYRGLIIEWISNPKNLITVANFLKGSL